MQRKLEDEQQEIAEVHRQLAEDERKQAATKATMQQEMNRVRAQNEAWIEAKRAAAAKVKEEDKALMRETMRTLEKQEADCLLYTSPSPRD